MNAQLHYMMVQHRSAELRRAGERARLATGGHSWFGPDTHQVPAGMTTARERD
jgi:hypothetical protein